MLSASVSAIRALDALAASRGVPGVILMENAGLRAADAIRSRWRAEPAACVVVAGKGNNAGDGYVVARHLANAGYRVSVAELADSAATGDAGVHRGAAVASGVEFAPYGEGSLAEAAIIVDGALGTGLHGRVREPYASAIADMNEAEAFIVSLDVPSGLDGDTGEPAGCAVMADLTVTFAACKRGLLMGDGPRHAGEVLVVDISIPRDLVDAALTDSDT